MNYFKKFTKLNVKYKDRIIPVFPLFIAVLGLFMVTIGGSYAYLTHVEESDLVNRITAGTLELTFSSKDNHINLINAVPQEDSVALSENDEYTFNIKNSGNITSYYEMRLEDVCEVGNDINGKTIDNCIPLEFVRVALKKGEGEYVVKHMNEEGSVLLDVDTLNGGADSDSFSLKIWLDINTPNTYNDKEKNIVFVSKLSLYAEQRYVQKVGAECLVIENNKIVDYTCSYSDIEIDSKLVNEVAQTSNNKVYRPKRLENINNYNEVELVDNVVVDTIASEAFKSKGLRSIIINSNITTIEDNAFLDNPALKDVVVGSVNLSAESFTTGGKIISMKNSNGEFPAACFNVSAAGSLNRYNCKSAVNIVIPLKDVTNSVDVKSIYEYTFKDLGLMSVDFSRTLNLTRIDRYAFYGNNIKVIDFSNNSNLTGVASYVFEKNNIYSVVLPDNITKVLPRAFAYNNIVSVVIPNGVTEIGVGAFQFNKLQEVTFGTSLVSIAEVAFYSNELENVKFSNKLESIGVNAFAENKIKSLVLPDSVISIGKSCFYNNKIESLYISENLTVIPDNAFQNNLIKKLDIPDGVTSIGTRSFQNNLLTSVDIPDGVTELLKQSFMNNKINSVSLPTTLITIGDGVFDKNEIASVVIPASVTSIGEYAFRNNKLTELVIPDSVTVVGSYAFAYNDILNLTLSNNLTSISDSVFHDNDITNLNIPENIISIGNYSFNGNDIERVVLPDNVISVGEYAFYNNRSASLVLNEGLQVIEKSAFKNNAFAEVEIPSTVTSIGAGAFSANGYLKKIINLPKIEFDWNLIINNTEGEPFITGDIDVLGKTVSVVAE